MSTPRTPTTTATTTTSTTSGSPRPQSGMLPLLRDSFQFLHQLCVTLALYSWIFSNKWSFIIWVNVKIWLQFFMKLFQILKIDYSHIFKKNWCSILNNHLCILGAQSIASGSSTYASTGAIPKGRGLGLQRPVASSGNVPDVGALRIGTNSPNVTVGSPSLSPVQPRSLEPSPISSR